MATDKLPSTLEVARGVAEKIDQEIFHLVQTAKLLGIELKTNKDLADFSRFIEDAQSGKLKADLAANQFRPKQYNIHAAMACQ